MKHSEVVRAVEQSLLALGVPAWKANTGAAVYQDPLRRRKRFTRYGMRGCPDVLAIMPPDGRFLGVEVKMGRDPVRDDQRRFIDAVRRAGGEVIVYRVKRDTEVDVYAAMERILSDRRIPVG
jgi:hypothetical protein